MTAAPEDGQDRSDFVILGGGPAGMSAALVASLNQVETLLLEGADRLGGQVRWADAPVPDLLGAAAEDGDELADRFAAHVCSSRARIRTAAPVRSIHQSARWLRVILASGEEILARRLLLATGLRHRQLAVPGVELARRFPAPRKMPDRFRDLRVVIVGGGDEASSLASDLAAEGATVSLLVRSRLRARPIYADAVRSAPGVELREGAVVSRFERRGESATTVVLTSGEILAADACFVRIGVEACLPQIEPDLEQLDDGRIRVDEQLRTSCDGLFAAGDLVRPPQHRYIATALADGTIVARHVEQDLAGRDRVRGD